MLETDKKQKEERRERQRQAETDRQIERQTDRQTDRFSFKANFSFPNYESQSTYPEISSTWAIGRFLVVR